jgi:hypothetical protein
MVFNLHSDKSFCMFDFRDCTFHGHHLIHIGQSKPIVHNPFRPLGFKDKSDKQIMFPHRRLTIYNLCDVKYFITSCLNSGTES